MKINNEKRKLTMSSNDEKVKLEIDVCPAHSGVIKTLDSLSEGVAEIKASMVDFHRLIQDKIIEYAQRPTWLVCAVVSTMSGIIGVLMTFIIYAHFGIK